MTLIGVGQFLFTMVSAMSGGGGSPPILFVVLGLPGLLLFGIGMQCTQAGYLKETTQYIAKETTPAVQTTTTAIRAAITDDDIPCPDCSRPIEPDSKFCAHCGVRIAGMTCMVCQATLEAGDRFCSSCGCAVEDATIA